MTIRRSRPPQWGHASTEGPASESDQRQRRPASQSVSRSTTATATRAAVCHAHAPLERRPRRKSTITWECDQNRAVSGAQPREPWDSREGRSGFNVFYAHVGTQPALGYLGTSPLKTSRASSSITFRRPTTGLGESFTSCRSTPYSTSPFSSARPIASFPERSCTQFSSPSDEGTLPLLCRRRIRY